MRLPAHFLELVMLCIPALYPPCPDQACVRVYLARSSECSKTLTTSGARIQGLRRSLRKKMEFSSGSLDDGSGSAPPDPVRQPRRQLPKEPEPCLQKRARNQLEAKDAELVPIAAMARLQLRKSRRSQRPNLNPLPTWGQLKKLTIEGQRLVLQAGKPLNPENLFLALCALLTVASGTEVPPHSYWAYIPNPPLLEPVKWGTSDILLYTTPREILSAPWADLTPHNQDDGTLFNFTYYGNQRPICIGEPLHPSGMAVLDSTWNKSRQQKDKASSLGCSNL
ncbi:endogenous retrovirus group K member 113 Env polyprotein-like isoform X3 [Cavia porcellus]|uniref:endogenous retrovirus group K member 113 Env polyprotein-like isoform X3 n=1 Tax=Cavia porcellus TaxID=10141 RepID=UPI002FDF306D